MTAPISQLRQASESQKERFDLKQQMLYETMKNFDAGDQPFPNEIIYRILSFLPPQQLLEAGRICKLWYQLASMNRLWKPYRLKALFPSEPIIDRNVWDAYVNLEQHGLDFEQKGYPCVESKRHYFELLQMASEVEDGQGISILTLPKGISLGKIVVFAAAPKGGGNTALVEILWQKIIDEQGHIELKEPVTVAITNGVFKNSRKMKVAKQIKLVKGLKCEMPQVVTLMALAILKFMSSDPNKPLRLFGNDPWTSTRCVEIIGGWHLVFGGFTTRGPRVYGDCHALRGGGLGGQRKFAINNP